MLRKRGWIVITQNLLNGQGENNSKPFALEIELEKYHFLMMALVIMMSVDSMF